MRSRRLAQGAPRAPARSVEPAGSGEIDRIRASLDRLAGSLHSIAGNTAQKSATPRGSALQDRASQRAVFHRSAASVPDFRDELDAVRNDLGRAVAAIGADPVGPQLRNEIRRLAETVARLEERGPAAPDDLQAQLEELSAGLHQLRGVVDDIARRPSPQIDIEDVARSIEGGYAQLASRMEESFGAILDHLSQPRGEAELHSEIGALAEHVTAIRMAMDSLPERPPLAAMEARLEDLARSIHQLADSDERTLVHHFGEIDERLDEITRALVAVSANHGGSDALDRIEARIATLSKTVETMAEDIHASTGAADGAEAFASEVRSALEAIDSRLAGVGEFSAGPAASLDEIAAQILQLSEKLDNLPALGAAASDLLGDDGELVSRLDEVVLRLGRLEESAAGAAARADQAPAATGEIAATLEELGARIDALADWRQVRLPEAEQLAALEGQLAGIVSRLETISSSGFDFSPIADRLDSIEQQVASSRDIAIDVASQAAERAVGLAAGASGIDPELIEALRAELANLEAGSRGGNVQSEEAFESVHDALSAIADRLADIEGRIGDSRDPVPNVAEASRGGERAAAGRAERNLGAEAGYAGKTAPASAASVTAGAVDPGDGGISHDLPEGAASDGGLPPVDEAPSLEVDELPVADVEDVPLEPGSGAPDLAALVRQASAKRKAGEKAASPHGASDLIAAARRAAQAAAQEASTVAREQPKVQPASRLSGLKAVLARHRRLLLLACAVVVVAGVSMPLVSKFVGSPSGVAPTSVIGAPADIGDATDAAPVAGMPAQPAPATSMPTTPDSTAGSDRPGAATPGDSPVAEHADADTATAGAPAAEGPQSTIPETGDSDGTVSGDAPAPGEAITQVPMPEAAIGNIALRQAAASGDGPALFEVARRYTDGDGVARDLVQALQWYEHSARAGFAPAQYRLGNFYEKGHAVPADIKKAVLWYQRAAEQGNSLAMHNLAVLFTSGLVAGEPDMEAAVEWFTRAAELGVKDSQVNLGILYTRGMGTDEDLVEAYKWFAVAARAGDSDAAGKRDMLASAMRPDQLEKARGLAELWKPADIDPAANNVEIRPEWKDIGGRAATTADVETTASIPAINTIGRVQALLAARGFDPGPADGVMGAKTREAVRAFQADAGMKVDGEISGELIRALENGAA